MADLDETGGQDVEQEAADELDRLQYPAYAWIRTLDMRGNQPDSTTD